MEKNLPGTKLFYAGFNGYLKLQSSHPLAGSAALTLYEPASAKTEQSCIETFTELKLPDSECHVLATFLSAIVLRNNDQLFHYGFTTHEEHPQLLEIQIDKQVAEVRHFFGDLSGLLGAVSSCGKLLVLGEKSEHRGLSLVHHERSLQAIRHRCKTDVRIRAIAIAGNDEFCIGVDEMSEPAGHVLHIFPGLQAFLQGTEPTASHSVPESVKTLQAGATAFVVLLHDDTVWTWGSPLQPGLLARSPDHETPARVPGLVDALGGIKIAKIAMCNWLGAALSTDRDLYVWGGRAGEAEGLDILPSQGEDVKLVELGGGVDIADISIGIGHILIQTTSGQIWGCGDHQHGQLGLGRSRAALATAWTKIDAMFDHNRKLQIQAGGWSSWIEPLRE